MQPKMVAQGRADWGVTIESVAREAGLRFRPLREESYDLILPRERSERPAVGALRELLAPRGELRARLEQAGFRAPETHD